MTDRDLVLRDQPRWEILEKRLLGIAGLTVSPIYEDNLEWLLEEGWDFAGCRINFLNSKNSTLKPLLELRKFDEKVEIILGWGLNGTDWFPHHWGYLASENAILEQNDVRKMAYFGRILTPDEVAHLSWLYRITPLFGNRH